MRKKELEELAMIIAWLDSARWSPQNQNTLGWTPFGLTSPSQEILLHWITYITDIQRPWQYVWKEGRKVFAEVVKSFATYDFPASQDVADTKQEVSTFLDKFRGPKEKKKVRPFVCKDTKPYAPRFPNQHNFIERTLTILLDRFDRNFMKFIGESIEQWSQDPNGLRHVAYDLYLLTYSDYPLDKTMELFDGNRNGKAEKYEKWRRFGYKRLWAALRDYRKAESYIHLFQEGLEEALGPTRGKRLYRIWTTAKGFSPRLLELPGDVWNINFTRRFVIPLAERHGIEIKKSWGASRIARKIYDHIGRKEFYPEQLDVSFDLSAIACENELCDLCPFSEYDLGKICLANVPEATRKKYCPVALTICQYRVICEPESCPLAKGIGRKLCVKTF